MNDLKEIGGFIVSADPYVNHDNSLSGNGTLTSPLGVVPGYNETVLWENTASKTTMNMSWPQQLSENISNFKRVRIYYNADGEQSQSVAPHEFEFDVKPTQNFNVSVYWNPPGTSYLFYRASFINMSGTNLNVVRNFTLNYPNGDNNTSGYNYIWKIVGINRKQ